MLINRRRQHYLASLALLICLAASVCSYLVGNSQAQELRAFDLKADRYLKQALQLHRAEAGSESAAMRQKARAEFQPLKQRIRIEETKGGAAAGVVITLRDDGEAAQAEIEARGFTLRARIGNIAVATALIADLPRLAEAGAIVRMRAAGFDYPAKALGRLSVEMARSVRAKSPAARRAALRALNDAANNAVKAPEARSTFNVTGRGVIVGVIDSGIDWRHGDFRKPDGATRIKALWDMSDDAGSGPGGVGRGYTEAQINAALQGGGQVNEKDLDGHGTHVAGTAAGNGLGTGGSYAPGTFAGIAPEADLVIVKATRSKDAGSSFARDDQIAAIRFIADQAAALNQPFVINMSLGGHGGFHDGSEGNEAAIDQMLSSGAGRQIVIAAGNEGQDALHAGGVIEQGDEVIVPFKQTANKGVLGVAYSGADSITARIIKPNGAIVGPVALGASARDEDVEIENSNSETGNGARQIVAEFKNGIEGAWRLALGAQRIANGRVDVWAISGTALDQAVLDGYSHVGIPATAKKGIAVANFVTKTQYTDINGVIQNKTHQGPAGQAAASSSAGPTRDNRLKPEIAAPGSFVVSTRSADARPDDDEILNDEGRHAVFFGTSMATPVVSGTIALMLQLNRNLSSDQIKRILWRTVSNDGFTGAAASPKYGYGKLNALAALQAVRDNVAASEFVSLSAASYASDAIASPSAIMAGFGANLASSVEVASSLPLPTTLAGVSVRVTDSRGAARLAPLFFVAPAQINYVVPGDAAFGAAKIDVLRQGEVVARGGLSVNNVWPALFTANASGRGLPAAAVVRLKANGEQVIESVEQPIDLSNPNERVFLALFGTGLRGRSDLSKVEMYLGGTPLNPLFAGPQGTYAGLDQVNVELPRSLAGRGQVDLLVYVDRWAANAVQLNLK